MKWFKTKYPGIRFREHETRRHGVQKDKYFVIRFRLEGQLKSEALGWASEGWTETRANETLAEIKKRIRTGEEIRTLSELRAENAQKKKRMEKENLSFGQFFNDTYMPVAIANRGKVYAQKEIGHFKNWINPIVGKIPFKNISPMHVERIKKNMLDAGRAPRTVQYCLAIFRQVWNSAKNHEFIDKDSPTKKVKIPSINNARERFLSHSEADELLEALKKRSTRMYQMALISLHCGLRASEIFKLTWSDIQIDKGILNLRDTKDGSNAHAFMTEKVKQLFRGMNPGEKNELLFKTRTGGLIKEIDPIFERVVGELGWNYGITDRREKVVFHSLRHTFASWMVEAGVDLYTVQKLMRHSNSKMTERYSHLRNESLQNAVRQMEAMIQTADAGEAIIQLPDLNNNNVKLK